MFRPGSLMEKKGKIAYACFCGDYVHEGHINIVNEAKKYGDVTVGILSDSQMVRFNKFPMHSLEERMEIMRAVPGVNNVYVQDEVMYDKVFKDLSPDYIVHGDNWLSGPQKIIRENVLENIKKYGGKLIDIPYTYDENAIKAVKKYRERIGMPEYRRGRIRKLLEITPIIKALEAHSGITGLIAENTIVESRSGLDQFDAMWVSSLCDSIEKGKPDIELVDMTSRFRTIEDILEVTTKPIIFDGDTGGLTEHFVYTVRTLERLGVSAIIIEDKIGLKRNSLLGVDAEQTQDTIESFSSKISAGKNSQLTDEFMIIARIESLILEKGVGDALERAYAYVKAGADGIMIHSRNKNPNEVFEFCDKFRTKDTDTPIVVVPSSYDTVKEDELIKHGVNIVIYANQLLRSAYPAMENTAKDILRNHRAFEAGQRMISLSEVISMIDEIQ